MMPVKWSYSGVETQLIVDGEDLVFRDRQVRTIVSVKSAGSKYYRVQTVVAARQRKDRQDRVFLGRNLVISSVQLLFELELRR